MPLLVLMMVMVLPLVEGVVMALPLVEGVVITLLLVVMAHQLALVAFVASVRVFVASDNAIFSSLSCQNRDLDLDLDLDLVDAFALWSILLL